MSTLLEQYLLNMRNRRRLMREIITTAPAPLPPTAGAELHGEIAGCATDIADALATTELQGATASADTGNNPRTLAEMAEAQEVLCDQAYNWAVVGAPMWDKIKELVLTSQWLDTRNPLSYGDLIDAAS